MAASFAIFLVMSCGNTEGNGRAKITADWIKEENELAAHINKIYRTKHGRPSTCSTRRKCHTRCVP